MKNCKSNNCHDGKGFHKKGPSSFWMQDSEILFKELNLAEDSYFLDFACGIGDYSIEALSYINEKGKVYAFDKNVDSVNFLKNRADIMQASNVFALMVDAAHEMPLLTETIDVCFLATALHAMPLHDIKDNLFTELHRVLKTNAKLAILECHKKQSMFGPAMQNRISKEELEQMLKPYGFALHSSYDFEHNYLMQFIKK